LFEKLAILNVSRRCNHACAFCSEGDVHTGEFVELAVIEKTLRELRERGYDSVNFMGAETTLRDDLPELLDLVHSHGLNAALTTNGVRLGEREFADAVLSRLEALELSLPAGEAETYRRVTGRGHWPHVQRALQHVSDVVLRLERPHYVTINVVVSRLNPTAPEDVARVVAGVDLGPRVLLHLIRARREGRAAEPDDLALDLASCAAAFRVGVRTARELGLRVMFRGLPLCALIDEAEHNMSVLEWIARPDNTYLNRRPLHEGLTLDDKVGLDRLGRSYPEQCGECSLSAVCPGVDPDVLEPGAEVGQRPPEIEPAAVVERLRAGPLGMMLPRAES
jgi:MoaA/NifB/PqqE/SkfB family radical SAM enzyme